MDAPQPSRERCAFEGMCLFLRVVPVRFRMVRFTSMSCEVRSLASLPQLQKCSRVPN
jgi:hypothetical protein